jgi:hypothetical protein
MAGDSARLGIVGGYIVLLRETRKVGDWDVEIRYVLWDQWRAQVVGAALRLFP